jgi:hypothetical protein
MSFDIFHALSTVITVISQGAVLRGQDTQHVWKKWEMREQF